MKFLCGLSVIVALIFGIFAFCCNQENNRLKWSREATAQRIRLLEDQLNEYEFKISSAKTYEEGYEAALVKMGRPQNPGTYQDGYDAAMQLIGDGSYAAGYHMAVKQFNFDEKLSKFIVKEPTETRESF